MSAAGSTNSEDLNYTNWVNINSLPNENIQIYPEGLCVDFLFRYLPRTDDHWAAVEIKHQPMDPTAENPECKQVVVRFSEDRVPKEEVQKWRGVVRFIKTFLNKHAKRVDLDLFMTVLENLQEYAEVELVD